MILSFHTYGQIKYPRYEKDSTGKEVVVLTIEQAQQLDNNTDLLVLFEKVNQQIGSYDSMCIKVINQKDEVVLWKQFNDAVPISIEFNINF
jgi:hypothetical protein